MGALRLATLGLALSFSSAGHSETVGEQLDRLVKAYPQTLAGHDDEFVFWRDGTKMSVGKPDKQKSFDDLLRKASILDQLSLP